MCGGGMEFVDPQVEKILSDPDNKALFKRVMRGELDTRKGRLELIKETGKLIWVDNPQES